MALHLFAGMGKVGEKESTSCGKNLLVKSIQAVYLDDSRVCQDCLKEDCLAPVADPAMVFEAKRLGVITGTTVINTGMISFVFLRDSGVSYDKIFEFLGYYGHAELIKDDEGKHWEICVMQSGHGQVFHSGN